MSLNDASILDGATVSATGGTAVTFSSLGGSLNSNTLYVVGDSDIRTRREMAINTLSGVVKPDAPNGYSQNRVKLRLKVPRTLANGNVSVDTLFIELATDVETSEANKDSMCVWGAQILTDTDFTELFRNGKMT